MDGRTASESPELPGLPVLRCNRIVIETKTKKKVDKFKS